MEAQALLNEIKQMGIELWVEGSHLRYRSPKGLLSAELLEKLKNNKDDILQLIQNGFEFSKQYPLSKGQDVLWFFNQLSPQSASYNIGTANRIRMTLDIPALKKACQEVVNRNSTLRTTYSIADDMPRQVVHSYQEVSFTEWDASGLSENELQALVQKQNDCPFDLEKGPVFRVDVFIRGENDYILLISVYHIAVDDTSMLIILHEIWNLYFSMRAGTKCILPVKRIQYSDFVLWQNSLLNSEAGERLWLYWQNKLSGELPVINLPTDRPRPPVQTNNGMTHVFLIDKMMTEQLKKISKKNGLTMYMVLVSGFFILLHKYTGQEDILIGSPTTGRTYSEFLDIVGYFINPVVIREDLSGNPSVKELFNKIRITVLDALEHQDYPLSLLADKLQPKRDASRPPLFQVMFNYLRGLNKNQVANDIFKNDDMRIEQYSLSEEEGQFDLLAGVREIDDLLYCSLKYNTDLFDKSTIARMEKHYMGILSSMIKDQDMRISEISLLTEQEQKLILCDWNDTHREYPNNLLINNLFEMQAEKSPHALALSYEDQRITYQELQSRSNQLAHFLQKTGVGRNSIVGICMEKSIESLVSVLGVWKAGAAYVPIDYTLPQERINRILNDSNASVVLLHEKFSYSISETTIIKVFIDSEWNKINLEKETTPTCVATPEDCAYIIYTSGSTGTPKGVMITHQGVVNAYYAWEEVYQLKDHVSCHLQMASFSFDVFVGDMIRTLASGGRLVLCSKDKLLEPDKLYRLMVNEKVDCAEFVPAVLRLMMEYLNTSRQKLDFMRIVIVGSDTWYIKELMQLQALCGPDTQIINSYGVSEATIDSTYFKDSEILVSHDGVVPIGRPFPNSELYILDNNLHPVPIGVYGELHISGPGLAKGYLNDEMLTQKKFIPNPFATSRYPRIYKTGDLARYLPGGTIEFIGRADKQIKIRGFRIEIEEIELFLNQHPSVKEALVIAKEVRDKDNRLLAYIIGKDKNISEFELKMFLKTKIPAYMIPSVFIFLERFPLNANGKIDLKLLPEPEMKIEDDFVSFRNNIEELLTNIWSEVLGLEQLSVYDDFFSVGGHSISATQVMSRIRTIFQIEIQLHTIFEEPTIAGLSKRIELMQNEKTSVMASPISPAQRNDLMPSSFAQQRLWFLYQLEGKSATYNIPLMLRIKGSLNKEALQISINKIIERHEILHTSFVMKDGNLYQNIMPPMEVSVNLVNLRKYNVEQQNINVKQHALDEALKPFDLQQFPLFRVTLVELGDDDHLFLFTIHHIIADGWSMGVIFYELSTFYYAIVNAKSILLPPLPIQYADYAVWQHQWLQGTTMDRLLQFWLTYLKNAPYGVQFPKDRPRPESPSFKGAYVDFSIPCDIFGKIKRIVRAEKSTMFITLLSLVKTLFHLYTGQEDIVITTPIANRNRREVEGLIGFFVNVLVLRNDLSGDPLLKDVIARVRNNSIKAFSFQDMPFEKVVEHMHISRSVDIRDYINVAFTFNEALPPAAVSNDEKASITPFDIEIGIAKTDITIYLNEVSQELWGRIEYNTDIFNKTTIEQLYSDFTKLVTCAADNYNEPISRLGILSDIKKFLKIDSRDNNHDVAVKDTVIHSENNDNNATILHLIEKNAVLNPDNCAVVYNDKKLTYRELNEQANMLANYLIAEGVNANDVIGICLDRSLEMIIVTLGVMKAGCTFVPVDPSYPQKRIAGMLEDARLSIVCTTEDLKMRLPQITARFITIDTQLKDSAYMNKANPAIKQKPEDLAYIIFTSGSTGRPKGVMVTHANLLNAYLGWEKAYNLRTSVSCHLQMANYAFDVFIGDFVRALCSGGKLVLCPKDALLLPGQLINLMQNEKVDCAEFVPVVLRNVMMYLKENNLTLDFMKLIVVGSDVWYVKEYEELKTLCDTKTRVINSYGVSETTIDATYFEGSTNELSRDSIVPIGKPFPNVVIYILDENKRPVNVGDAGELYIGGAGVSRGYLNRDDLTKQKFTKDPFDESNGLIYATGDVCRLLPDGTIEFIGRADTQVKIRGIRVELGEVESVIANYAGIKEAAVGVENDLDDQKLVAYVVAMKEEIDIPSLRDYCNKRLPHHMVPAEYIQLDSMPISPNGKIDRIALSKMKNAQDKKNVVKEHTGGENSNALISISQNDDLELKMIKIWEEALHVRPIGLFDDFFDLGGHSFLAIKLIAKIEKELTIKIPLIKMFPNSSVDKLLRIIRKEEAISTWSPLAPLNTNGNGIPFFCALPAGFSSSFFKLLSQYSGNDNPFYILESYGIDFKMQPFERLEKIAANHIEILKPYLGRPIILGGFCVGGSIAYEMAQQLQQQGHAVASLILIDAIPAQSYGYSDETIRFLMFIENISVLLKYDFYPEVFKELKISNTNNQVELYTNISKLSNKERQDLLTNIIKKNHIVETDVLDDYINRLYANYTVQSQALSSYVAKQYTGNTILIKAAKSIFLPLHGPSLGWQRYVPENLKLYEIPGDHYSIISEEQYVKHLGETLQNIFNTVQISNKELRNAK